MIIPAFIREQFVDENGYLTSAMQLYNDELNNILRNGLSDNGWTVPQATTAQISQIIAFTGTQQMPVGTIWFNTNTKKLYVLVSNSPPTIEQIQSL